MKKRAKPTGTASDRRAYYKRGGIEAIDVIEAWELGFNLGTVLKYVARCGVKTPDPLEDLIKTRYYLNREIAKLLKKMGS